MSLDPMKDLRRRLDVLEAQMRSKRLESASITNGRLRLIGGLFRVEAGGRVEIVGFLQVDGQTDITGPVTISGSLSVTGPWTLAGNGDITGDVQSAGDWQQSGDFEVLGGGRIKVGNVIITPGSGGRVTVGVGAAQIVLNGQNGTIRAGDLTIDPTLGGGAVQFDNGAQIYSAGNGQIELVSGNGSHTVTLRDDRLGLNHEVITSPRFTVATESDIENIEWIGRDKTDGNWKLVPAGMGGPTGGPLEFPFALSLVTSEFGMRDHPDGTGPRMHEGMDFAPPAGTPIPAAGSGVVASSTSSTGYGNEVWIDHGVIRGQRIRTHYAHMQAPGVAEGTALGKGATVGAVGNTGESFGAHLHFEVEVDGVKVNPRDVITEEPTS